MNRQRAAVLASGGGSNLQALLDHLATLGGERALDVVLVASDRADAGALDRAQRMGIPTAIVRSTRHPDAPEIIDVLQRHAVNLVVLAGYLRLVPPAVAVAYRGRMLNVHPGPLPAFGGPGMYGARVHRAVLAAGVSHSGPTVHHVDEVYDRGPRLAHWPVPVLPHDDEQTLGVRVLRAEHLLFPRVVQGLAKAYATAPPDAAFGAGEPLTLAPFDPALDDEMLGRQLDSALGPAA